MLQFRFKVPDWEECKGIVIEKSNSTYLDWVEKMLLAGVVLRHRVKLNFRRFDQENYLFKLGQQNCRNIGSVYYSDKIVD